MERERLQDYTGNGAPATPTFTAAEMRRRLDAIRAHMAASDIDAALFTSYHCIDYYSDFLYCQFGRRYGLLVDHDGLHLDQRRHRRRPALAAHLRREKRHLHRLAPGQLLPRHPRL